MTCERCHSELVRFTVVADRPPRRVLGVCLWCPRGSRYHDLAPTGGASEPLGLTQLPAQTGLG